MKTIATALLLGLVSIAYGQTSKKVLFVGNSYTGVNNLPVMVYQAALSTNDTLIYDSNTPGGHRFLSHAGNATTISKIFSQNWDFVSLQAQSQEASWPQIDLDTSVFPYAKILCDTIRANDICSKPLFYTTWGRENGDASNCNYAPHVCTYAGMDSALTNAYNTMASDNNGVVSPVGPVWRYLRNNSSINLYASDGSHPSLAGSYAAACTFYTMIFGKDPTGITWNSFLSSSVADTIKAAAKRIAYDSLASWNYSIPRQGCNSATNVVRHKWSNDLNVFPNPIQNDVTIDLGEVHKTMLVTVMNLNGQSIFSKRYSDSQVVNLELNQPAGVYILTIESNDQKKVIRLIKE